MTLMLRFCVNEFVGKLGRRRRLTFTLKSLLSFRFALVDLCRKGFGF
ncbi:MAG: hypothetical protein ACTS4U_01660 [Candidatus Hodgkinia cicadicola]